jgi:hypothetical protein
LIILSRRARFSAFAVPLRREAGFMTRALYLFLFLVLTGCASAPLPQARDIDDACRLLTGAPGWNDAVRDSARRWGAPIGLQLAIIRQESGFDPDARPPRGERRLFGLIEGERPSSAYGYAQALDATWDRYRAETGRFGASRRSFRDATDFIGWYVDLTGRMTGIGQYDYRDHYLAYHEGQSGFLSGTHRTKDWLLKTARQVAQQASLYEKQVADCRGLRGGVFNLF